MNAVDQVREAHQTLRRAVGPKRREAHREEGALAESYRVAMQIWSSMATDGASFEDRSVALEKTLRVSWPDNGTCHCPRCRWVCRDCEDTGALHEKRPARIYGNRLVDVVVPCHCEKGRLFAPKQASREDFTAAGKSSKPMSKAWVR